MNINDLRRRWLAFRIRRVLQQRGLTYEDSRKIEAIKSLDLVQYLRARRKIQSRYGHDWRKFGSTYLKNVRFLRKEHLKRKKMGLPPRRIR